MERLDFEESRKLFYERHRPLGFVDDGTVVLEAAKRGQFKDPGLEIVLKAEDLEALGIRGKFTRNEIIKCLTEKIEDPKSVYFLPGWSRSYAKTSQVRGQVLDLLSARKEAYESSFETIKQVIDFCAEDQSSDDDLDEPEPRAAVGIILELCKRDEMAVKGQEKVETPTLWSKLAKTVRRLFGK